MSVQRLLSNSAIKFKSVTHVIFDLDGLLLDTEVVYTKLNNEILSRYGKELDWAIKLQIMGLTGKAQADKVVELLELPITGAEYYHEIKERYDLLLCNASLMPDTEKVYKKAICEIGKRFGKVYTNEMAGKVIGTRDTVSSQIAVREMKLPISPSDFLIEFRNKTNLHFEANPTTLMKGAEKLVNHLHSHKVPIAIATSSHSTSFEIKTRHYQHFIKLFNHVVTGGDDPEVKEGKPSPDVFLVCAARFTDKPKSEKCLVFEDAPNGVEAAVAANMQCVIVPDKHVPQEMYRKATLKLNSLLEFEPELFGLPPMKQNGCA